MTRYLLFAAVALTGCSEFNLTNAPKDQVLPQPDILVTPPALEYGVVSSTGEEVKSFTIENIGGAPLSISNIAVEASSSFTVISPLEYVLEMGEKVDIDVSFIPHEANENFGQVVVFSDDPDTPEKPVDLLGHGAVPELEIDPPSYNFGDAVIPCGDSLDVTMTNIGLEDLVITEVDYTSGGFLSVDTTGLPALPLTLKPGEFVELVVDFAAADAAADTGILSVTSNDPRGVVEADQNGEGVYGSVSSETFTEPGVPPVDVMFLIDQSCSMEEDNVDDIQQGMPGFVAELQNVSDWQLIEVTRENGCSNQGVMDASTANVSNKMVNNAFNSSHHSKTEALLELANIALSKTGPGQCNEGFLRPGALLHIITASDEREQSGRGHTHWLNKYYSYVPSPDFVVVSAIADTNTSCGDGSGATGYRGAANDTGGTLLNICNNNWGTQLTDIAAEIVAGVRAFNLADPAVSSSVQVEVNGVPTTDWDYAPAGNTVTVNSPPVGEGDIVTVNYAPAGICN